MSHKKTQKDVDGVPGTNEERLQNLLLLFSKTENMNWTSVNRRLKICKYMDGSPAGSINWLQGKSNSNEHFHMVMLAELLHFQIRFVCFAYRVVL